jgi:hypothetical protein
MHHEIALASNFLTRYNLKKFDLPHALQTSSRLLFLRQRGVFEVPQAAHTLLEELEGGESDIFPGV